MAKVSLPGNPEVWAIVEDPMTLRDQLAMAALPGLVNTLMAGTDMRRRVVMLAYAYADTALEVRGIAPDVIALNVERSKSSLGSV